MSNFPCLGHFLVIHPSAEGRPGSVAPRGILGRMEIKSTDLLKVLQRAHEKEPHEDEVAVASSVAARCGRNTEEHDEF